MIRRLALLAAAVAALSLTALPSARAGITSLWADDATLVKQLGELMAINDELDTISGGMQVTARAAHATLGLYLDTRAAISEIQSYSPGAFWRDFKADLYSHYPGFQYLEGGDRRLLAWKQSRSKSPAVAYEMIGAVFGDLTAPLRDAETAGRFDGRGLRLRRHEASGALSLASAAAEATKDFDDDARRLYQQAETTQSGEAAQILSAKASAMLAIQNSHLIRLLARRLRLDGVRSAIDYGEQVAAANSLARDLASARDHQRDARTPPALMTFPPLF